MTAAKTPAKTAPTPKARTTRARPAPDASWDAFWSEQKRKRQAELGTAAKVIIRGVEVVKPHDLPMRFDQQLTDLADSDDENDIRGLVVDLFGKDVIDAWVANGMEDEEFKVILLWGVAVGRGRDITFEQAYEAVQSEGKSLAPNRSARRASARSGGPSKRTSRASTASPRKR